MIKETSDAPGVFAPNCGGNDFLQLFCLNLILNLCDSKKEKSPSCSYGRLSAASRHIKPWADDPPPAPRDGSHVSHEDFSALIVNFAGVDAETLCRG